jgi:hypothetical protein
MQKKPNYPRYCAKVIVRYFDLYRQYLMENNLPDDSNSIHVKDLVDFVEQQINPDLSKLY